MTNKLPKKLKLFFKVALSGIFILLTVTILTLPSCKNYDNNAQIRRIDTIISMNNNTKNMLVIDEQSIKQRSDSMKIKIALFDSVAAKINDDQFRSDLVSYKGLLSKYNNFIDNYAEAEFSCITNSKTLDEIKKKIVDHQFSLSSSDSILNNQEKIIRNQMLQTKDLVQTIFSVEEMYQRLNNRLNTVLKKNIRKDLKE